MDHSEDPDPRLRLGKALADAQENRRRARMIRENLQLVAFRCWVANFVNRCWAECRDRK